MAHDQYPVGEAKTSYTQSLKEKVIVSIDNGNIGNLVAARVTEARDVIDVLDTQNATLIKVAEVLKPSNSADTVRWVEQHNLTDVPEEQQELVFSLADEFGLRLPVDHELPVVENPLIAIEGGANRTSVVRRGLAEKMLGDEGGIMYQFGSPNRIIAPTRTDKEGNVVENAEYKVISADDICGDLEGETVSEFDVNVASAVSAGYEITDDQSDTHVTLQKGNIQLVVLRAASLKDGIAKIAEAGVVDGRNIVISTNGQYRTKDIIQTEAVLAEVGVAAESVQAIGDETGKRDAKIYIAELAVVLRELSK